MRFSFSSFAYLVFIINIDKNYGFYTNILLHSRTSNINGNTYLSNDVQTSLVGYFHIKKKHLSKNQLKFYDFTKIANYTSRNSIMGKRKLDEDMDNNPQKSTSLNKAKKIDIIEIKDSTLEEPSTTEEKSSNHAFDLLTWNLDGLDDRFLRIRIDYICDIIKFTKPDVIFLQEIIKLTEERLHKNLAADYHFILPRWEDNRIASYYCLILVSKSTCSIFPDNTQTDWFENSVMYRYLLSTLITLKSFPQESIELMTTHLESTWQFSNQRVIQLKKVIKKLCKFDIKNNNKARLVTKIFGGDLNLVDSEVKKANLPEHIKDCWEFLGCPQESKYTWDLKLNKNIESSAKNKARRRFDRIFTSSIIKEMTADSSNLEPDHIYIPYRMKLIGTSHIEACDMFPSDHFGLYTRFQRVKSNE